MPTQNKNFRVKNGIDAEGTITGTALAVSGGTSSQFLKANGSVDSSTYITGSSPTITTPTIDTINISGAAIAAALWNTTVTTGSISMGGALTTGGVNIATGTAFNGTVAIGTGAGTVNKTINIGTASTSGTTAITLGSSSGATSTVQLNGAVTGSSTLTLSGATLNINGASPTISSTNASAASIFTSNVTGITIGSSTIRTTAFPADGTTSTAAAGSGFMGMPQVVVSSGGRTLAATDAGKHIYMTTTSGQTITIPANGTTAFPIGTTIVIINGNGISTTISITTDTLRLANTTSTGSRTLASNGMCTLVKINTTEWIVGGNGIS